MFIYTISIHTRRKDEAKTPSLLDRFGHFDVPIFDAKDPSLRSPTFDSPISDAEAPSLDTQSSS